MRWQVCPRARAVCHTQDFSVSGLRCGCLHTRNALLLSALDNISYFATISNQTQVAACTRAFTVCAMLVPPLLRISSPPQRVERCAATLQSSTTLQPQSRAHFASIWPALRLSAAEMCVRMCRPCGQLAALYASSQLTAACVLWCGSGACASYWTMRRGWTATWRRIRADCGRRGTRSRVRQACVHARMHATHWVHAPTRR